MPIKRYILTALLLLFALGASAQINPVSWRHEVKETSTPDVYEVTFMAEIDSPWHMYDLGPYEGLGPNPTTFEFTPSEGIELVGKLGQKILPKRIEDPIFGMEIGYFSGRASFSQRVKTTSETAVQWQATVSYQVCDDQSCLAPTDHDFFIRIPAAKPKPAAAADDLLPDSDDETAGDPQEEPSIEPVTSGSGVVAKNEPVPEADDPALAAPESEQKSLWGIILEAILWGLAAFLTPCVFPMAPMTVSFFLKGGENKARGKFMASMYGLFIVLLYTIPIAVIILTTYLIGGENVTTSIFNWIATHWLPNILFFVVFMVFAASFFGAFEIRMPTKWINKADGKSDKGGLFGVFFMALTLVLVSFSCTGPIVSSVLVKSTQGEIWEPIITMLAFSLAFALPFTVLAFFPSLLNNLPKSGGWLNSVKVTLGFVEVALGLKFLSIADQTYHWGILDREVYLAIWIMVFTLLGLYLLGKIRFKHDSEVKHIGVFRLSLVILIFSFVVYLIPGMWGAPLKALSGYLPPMHTQDFVLGSGGSSASARTTPGSVKYGDFLHLPHNLTGFFDYDEGMAYAKEVGKPVFIDITGHGCVNCREMEARVWSDPEVLRLMREVYIIIALYVDDKTRLPESDWVTDSRGKVLKGLGQINADFALRKFGTNAQPYYILLDNAGNRLVPPRAYNLDIQAFVDFLKAGVAAYKQ